ncbi:MAG: hypothetical protein O2856_00315 [Planctomycetota bacterium]|nr:hypothetical protein [Planctomycetota bacterium]
MRNIRTQNAQGGSPVIQRNCFRSRRGTMMLWSVWVFLAMLMIAACSFNVIWLSCVRSEARRHAESAVIAGGHAFLSDDMLRTRQQPFEHDGREVRCRNAVVNHLCQACDPSLARIATDRDVELISESELAYSGNSDFIQPIATVPNQIHLTYGKDEGNDQLRMFFSGLTNARHARLGVSASANIEHRPVGFLPGGRLTIPVLPFGVLDQSQEGSSVATGRGLWSERIESGNGFDDVTWNPDLHSVENGPDGLPEITLTLSPNAPVNEPDSFVPLKFAASSAAGNTSQPVGWMKNGVSSEDLKTLGLKQLSFPSTISASTLSTTECAEIAAWLQSHTGQSFIVCLCNPTISTTNPSTATSSLSTVELNRAVAARIMGCGVSPAGNVRVLLQPCVLITSTAVTSPSLQTPLNRYIYSVRLSQ